MPVCESVEFVGCLRWVKSRRFDRASVTPGLPRAADILGVGRHVSNVPIAVVIGYVSVAACGLNPKVRDSHAGA